MSKQVEVPEGVEPIFIDRETRTVYFGPSMREQVVSVDDLPLIYKHFADRLLSDGAKAAVAKILSDAPVLHKDVHAARMDARVTRILTAALQATPIPTTSDEEAAGLEAVRGSLRAIAKGPTQAPTSLDAALGLIEQARELGQEALMALERASTPARQNEES